MKHFPSVKRNSDFQSVYKTGKSWADRLLVMYVRKNEKGYNRIGISVSKKVGNSVKRHRLIRLVREGFRLNPISINNTFDIVVVVRKSAKDENYHTVLKSILYLYKKHNLI